MASESGILKSTDLTFLEALANNCRLLCAVVRVLKSTQVFVLRSITGKEDRGLLFEDMILGVEQQTLGQW